MAGRHSLMTAATAALAAIAFAFLGAGCGAEFKLPTERTENRAAPSDGSYQMIATWTGLDGVTDALLIPGPQLFLAFRGNPGRVVQYSTTSPFPIATGRFLGVQNPASLAASPTSVFVLDQGDTAAARDFGGPGAVYELDCNGIPAPMTRAAGSPIDWRLIKDLSKYWFVREYDLTGRNSRGAFTDTTFAYVYGIAADSQGRIYVAGVIKFCSVDPFDPLGVLRSLEHRYRIYRYVRGSGDRYVVGVPAAPGGTPPEWRRDRTFEVVEGTGIGSTQDPRGMAWSAATGSALFFADRGNDEAQKFDEFGSLGNSYKLGFCEADTLGDLVTPVDVDVDGPGFVYVVDPGNRRVLRYDPQGTCVQRVDIEPNALGQRLTGPVAVAAGVIDGLDYAYVVDAAVGQVVRYRRRL